MTTVYIVWNDAKTEGFVTNDEQLAYEVRKSADSNLYSVDGEYSPVAKAFCDRWFMDTCSIEQIKSK